MIKQRRNHVERLVLRGIVFDIKSSFLEEKLEKFLSQKI